jgi:hypothetical protein
MKFMYMDECCKNLISNHNHTVYIYGGMIIDKKDVHAALSDFKGIYQRAKTYLKERMKQQLKNNPDKGNIMQTVFDKFELHAAQIFNPDHTIRKGQIKRYNPWKYSDPRETFNILHTLIDKLTPYISEILIFKIDKSNILNYGTKKGINIDDNYVDEKIIEFIIEEYDTWLKKFNQKGALIPDKLDSGLRDKFVDKINMINPDFFWSEPIVVESYSNAFTQLIDIITYCYYLVYTNASHKQNFKAIQRLYYKRIKPKVVEKDLYEKLAE